MALSRYTGYKLEWFGRIRSKYCPYGSCPASDSALGAVTRPKSPNFAPLACAPQRRIQLVLERTAGTGEPRALRRFGNFCGALGGFVK